MNSRVLELLKNPKNIQSEDLNLLKEEINSFPYIQNIRALHLYGIHLYDQENYQKELSTTAAYTTDKKILYQLINGKIKEKTKPEVSENKSVKDLENGSRYFPKSKNFPIKREELPGKTQPKEETIVQLPTPFLEIKHVYVNGERNRILFEGEENFLEENHNETIDIESTLESGTLVTQKPKELNSEESASPIVSVEHQEVEKVDQNEEQKDPSVDEELITKEENKSVNNISEPSVEHVVQIEEDTDETELREIETSKKTEFTPEEIINEDEITSESEKDKVSNDSELSFHGTDSFMPDVIIESNNTDELAVPEISKPTVNKHEDEMRRLIEEVEKKMKAGKTVTEDKKESEPQVISRDINFAETQAFHAVETKVEDAKPEVIHHTAEASEASEGKKEEIVAEVKAEIQSGWKPMSFESHVPDSLINKSTLVSPPKEEVINTEIPKEEKIVAPVQIVHEVTEDKKAEESTQGVVGREDIAIEEEKKEEAPVMNVSFFSSDISSLALSGKKEELHDDIEEDVIPLENAEEKTLDPDDSNIPGFINTWQSWLKIDRTEKEPEKIKAEVKSKVIESFIENNPKISQLKDESSFVVKEKNDDISHLMTETLAKLYFEQKLYTKAIKAFEILANKHPERKSYFEDKIQEVKDIRGKN